MRAISSQATEGKGSVEGSTTMEVSPNNNPPHERPTRKGRYSLSCMDNMQNHGLNGHEVTKLNSVPFTSKLDNLSEHPVKQIINKVLKFDAAKAFDTAAHAQFKASYLTVYPATTTSITLGSASSYAGSATTHMAKEHVGLIMDAMKERNIPGYVGDDYYCLAHPTTFSGLKDDLDAIHIYVTEGYNLVANGECGRYRGCRFVEQTNIAKDATTSTDWAFFFGNDTVAEAIAVPEEMRGKIPSDYGRSKGVAWLTNQVGQA